MAEKADKGNDVDERGDRKNNESVEEGGKNDEGKEKGDEKNNEDAEESEKTTRAKRTPRIQRRATTAKTLKRRGQHERSHNTCTTAYYWYPRCRYLHCRFDHAADRCEAHCR